MTHFAIDDYAADLSLARWLIFGDNPQCPAAPDEGAILLADLVKRGYQPAEVLLSEIQGGGLRSSD